MNTNTAVTPLPAVKKRRISPITVVCVLVAAGAFLPCYYAWDNLSGGWFHADRMNGIVEAVRRQQFGEEEVIFRVEDFSRPESLQRLQHSLQAAPNVWARKKNGALQVAIITRDSGHIGGYGFVFSEVAVTETSKIQGSAYYDVIGPMGELGGKVDDYWWRAANRDR